VAKEPVECSGAAHGGVTHVDCCSCGAERRTESNGTHVQRGAWSGPHHTTRVVTWSAPSGGTIDICTACQERLEAAGEGWPRNRSGQEYCQVHQGLHNGECSRNPATRLE
jgi:hypothetical protein